MKAARETPVIVEASTVEVGDVVRRPVPGAEELVVETVDRDARALRVRSRDDGATFDMRWDAAAKWLVLLARGGAA